MTGSSEERHQPRQSAAAAGPASDRDYWRRGSLIMIVAGVGGFAADYALNLGAARLLPPHDYGDFKVALAFLNLASLVVLLGGDRAAPRFLASWIQSGDRTGVWEYARLYLMVILGLSILLIAGTVVASILHFGPVDLAKHHPLLIAALIVPIGAISTLLARIFLAAKYLGRANLPWRIGYPLSKLGLILAVATFAGSITDFGALWLAMVAATGMLGYQIFEMRRLSLMPLVRAPQLAAPRAWLVASVPMMMVLLLQIGIGQVDIFMLEMIGNETDVGHFGAATTTVRSLILVQNTALGLLAPLMAAALKEGPDRVNALHVRGFRMLVIFSLPVALLLVVFGGDILSLFGPTYVAAYPALVILTGGFLFSTLLALSSAWLQYGGHERDVMKVMIATLVANIILNLILIPLFGTIGAATGTAVILVGSACAFSVLMKRRLGVSPLPVLALFRSGERA